MNLRLGDALIIPGYNMKKIKIGALLLASLMTIGPMCACDGADEPTPDRETVMDTEAEQTPSESAGNSGSNETREPSTGNSEPNETREPSAGTSTPEESGNGTAKPEEPEKNYNILSIGAFHDGLAVISTDQGYGYITPQGNIAIEPIYEMASVFDTLALVQYQGTLQYINRNGDAVYTHKGTEKDLGAYKNDFFWVKTTEETLAGNISTMTYYDQNGQKVFSVERATEALQEAPQNNLNAWNRITSSMSSFNEYGYAVVEIDGKNKFIDTKGQIVSIETFGIDAKDYSVTKQRDQVAVISENAYFLDYASKKSVHLGSYQSLIIYDPPVLHLQENYYATYSRSTYNKQYSGIHYRGEPILDFKNISALGGATVKAVSVSKVENELYLILYAVNADGVFFSIISDLEGNFITTPTKQYALGYQTLSLKDGAYRYEDFEAYAFHKGLCKAQDTETGLFGYIDLTGNWVIPAQYESVTDFYGEGDDAVAVVNGDTVINRKGEVIFSTHGQN